MAEIVELNRETVTDFIRRNGHATTEQIKARFSLTDETMKELMPALAAAGHVKSTWVLGDLYSPEAIKGPCDITDPNPCPDCNC